MAINFFSNVHITDADAPCKEFDNGTPLHIACSNVCLKAAKCLVSVFP